MTLPFVLWIGGGSAAGKTTISRTITLQHDLAWYRVDAHAYEHRDRLVESGVIEKETGNHDERWLDPTPEELANTFIERSGQLFPLIVDDLREYREQEESVGVVVEGPQLFPALVEPAMGSRANGLWLLPTEEFQRRMLTERRGNASSFTSDAKRAFDNLVARNRLLDKRVRDQATDLRLTLVAVDGATDLAEMTQAVEDHFEGALAALPRAGDGEQRAALRRRENNDMMTNFKAFLADTGQSPSEDQRLPFACECTTLGCEAIIDETPLGYDEHRAAGEPIAGHPQATP